MTEQDYLYGQVDKASRLLCILANPKRLQIMHILMAGEIAVSELAEKVGLSQSALSQHLAKFRAEDLVVTRRVAQTIYYRGASEAADRLLKVLGEIYNIDCRKLENVA